MADAGALDVDMGEGAVRLERMADRHVEPLRGACARDLEIWNIYPVSWHGVHFERTLAESARLTECGARVPFVIVWNGEVVGMTCYLGPDPANGVVEIGGTYIEPSVRGTGVNSIMKRLMIERAFGAGFARIEWRVDTRNARSLAAVAKLGATREGTLRRNRITWTGHVRDTAVFGLLKDEWSESHKG
ncbi:MAG: GNAT family protein [bacterium]|nr:GNAT family protein [bacterium]